MPTAVKRALKVFLCHASGDKPAVRDLYKRLVTEGVDAWLDQEKLLPGQDWRMEIPRAVREADVVVICLSKNSITKEGYVQKEIRFALDIAEEKPEGTIFLIPARLEDCIVPERLNRWQWVDLFDENGLIKLLRSLKLRADAVDATVEPASYVDVNEELDHRLEQLYTEGLAAFYTEDWDKACQRFQAILSERPERKNAAEKLEEAKRRRNLAKLYEQAADAVRSENWEIAIQTLEELSQKSADYKDTTQLLRNARKQKQLRALYSEARTLHAAQKWEAVVKVFEQISAIDPVYPDTDGLLPYAQKEVAEIKRIAGLNELYSCSLDEMDAGNWHEARRLLERVHKAQTGFLETEVLLKKVEDEIVKIEENNKRANQVNMLYEQAHGLSRSKKWRYALDKLEQIRKLSDNFQDTDGIAEKAQRELAREEQETEHQNQLAALYAEAVSLLKEEKYQEALDQWQKVKAIDPKYPDRQGVQRSVKRKLTQKKHSQKKWQIKSPTYYRKLALIAGLCGLILLVFIGMLIYAKQPPKLPACVVGSLEDPLLLNSKLNSSPIFVDGKITYPSEWEDAQCYQVFLFKWVSGQGCTGNRLLLSTWFVKNDGQRLYLLTRISKITFSSGGVAVGYYYPYPLTGSWLFSDAMGFGDGKPLDQFGWDGNIWQDDVSEGGSMDTRAKSTIDDRYYWYEFSKPLDSGDGHDWSWKAGDKVGTGITGDLMIGSWGHLSSGGEDTYLCRHIQLQLHK